MILINAVNKLYHCGFFIWVRLIVKYLLYRFYGYTTTGTFNILGFLNVIKIAVLEKM